MFADQFEPVGESEVYTRRLTVSPEMTPTDVVTGILGDTPWRNGHYKGSGGFIDRLVLTKDVAVSLPSSGEYKLTFKYGQFGKASQRIAEKSGKLNFTVKVTCKILDKDIVDHGVLMDNGTTFFIENMMGLWTLEWITEEEAKELENDGDPIDAPPNQYKVEPERQGRLIWITGPPGLGKSTSAQLLSREHGYVYYEGDCFYRLKNPYIPPDVENPSLAQVKQRKLVGEGVCERRKICNEAVKQGRLRMAGKEYDVAAEDAIYKEMCKDIARERARIGGDWAIATVLDSPHLRDIVRLVFSSQSPLNVSVRGELGPELEIVVLSMTLEEQKARIRGRHEGNEDVVGLMEVTN